MDVDVGIFSRKFQKFYFSNDARGTKMEFGTTDPRADKLVCIPYQQYIDIQTEYTCKKK